jgi:hypothetical protein
MRGSAISADAQWIPLENWRSKEQRPMVQKGQPLAKTQPCVGTSTVAATAWIRKALQTKAALQENRLRFTTSGETRPHSVIRFDSQAPGKARFSRAQNFQTSDG